MSYAAVCFLLGTVAVVLGYTELAAALAGFVKVLFVLNSASRLQRGRRPVVETL